MRKVIVEIEPYETTREAQRSLFTHIHSYEVLEVLKMDHEKGLYVDLIECILKEGVSIDELTSIGNMDILSVIRSEGDKHICLVLGHESDEANERFKGLELNLIYTAPSLISEDRIIVSFISSQRDMARFVEVVKAHIGKVVKMTFKQSTYEKKDLLTLLTDKQREVMAAAYKHGYYDVPRMISSEKLAEKVSISKPTLIEHLRKAERRIINEILAGSPELNK
ncbi:MAG: helix-turn-helix domain-containing protein [Methanomassiliicoccus sp.]|nr:helix-turn-helix domain-containing protein [Methanomassiliicoccus sp.]